MIKKIRLGALACSSIAERNVLPAVLKSDDVILKYVASRSARKASEFASKFACKACTYEELLEKDDIDAVYVSLPVGMHHEWGMKIIAAGKHVLMEKTFTTDIAQAEELIKSAREKKVVAMEGLVYIYHPLFKKVIELVHSGAIGELRHIHACFGFPFLKGDNIRNSFQLGGGAILDALIYPLSFSFYVARKPCTSFTANTFQDNGSDVDTRGIVQLDWEQVSAQIAYGFGFTYRNQYCVWGDTGYLTVDRAFSRPSDMKGEIAISSQGGLQTVNIDPADQFKLMINAFADKVRGIDTSGINESGDITGRMKIISEIHGKHYEKYNA